MNGYYTEIHKDDWGRYIATLRKDIHLLHRTKPQYSKQNAIMLLNRKIDRLNNKMPTRNTDIPHYKE